MRAHRLLATALLLVLPIVSGAQDAGEGEFLVIKGEVLRPEITVVISRENLNKTYELKLDESFLDKILRSVEKPPF